MPTSAARWKDLAQKAWGYGVDLLERPSDLPWMLRRIASGDVHPGQLIRLARHRAWLEGAGIRTVLDVGAHTGQFASAIGAIVPDAAIHSFEPLPECVTVLRQKMAHHGAFDARQVAVGDHAGEVDFFRSSFSESSSALAMAPMHKEAFPWTADLEPLRVRMDTLDSLLEGVTLEPNVLLKVDVQGLESAVLRGAERTLGEVAFAIVEVSFEPLYDGQSSFREVFDAFAGHGFAFHGILDQMQWPPTGRILQGDALFQRS